MGKSKPPSPPDPVETYGAQQQASIGTAIANGVMGNVNQRTPFGNLTFNQTGTYNFTDPLTGKTTPLPRYTATTTLSPDQQRLQTTQTQAQQNLAGLARDQSARLGGILGRPMDTSGAPTVQDPALRGVKYRKTAQGTFGDAGDITRSYSTDFSQDRQRVEDALMARLNPSLERDRGRLESNLSNRGIKLGSTAYDRGVDEFTRQSNDARLGAILGAGEEQSRLVGMEAARAGFQNQAQQQAYNQALGRQSFMNDARQQGLQNMLGTAGFNNNVVQQRFGNQRGLRGDYMQEAYAARNQPINEIGALLGTGQVQNPNFVNTQAPQMPTTDYAGLVGQNYNQRLAGWQTQQQFNPWNGVMGGLFGLGSAGILAR